MTASLARSLAEETLESLVSTLQLREVGAPRLALADPRGTPVGALRRFVGEAAAIVTISLGVPAFGLDSHMIFAFTPPASPVPHFTLDAVQAGPGYSYHLDLVPRVDLAAHLGYADAVYGPLTGLFEEAGARPGLSPARLSPRQRALMSPWMLVHHADATAFAALGPTVRAYRERWLELCARGLPSVVADDVADVDLPGRDRRLRDALFSPDVDPVWALVDRLVGAERSAELRRFLRGEAE